MTVPEVDTEQVVFSTEIELSDGEKVMVHGVSHPLATTTISVESFSDSVRLVDWCNENDATEALVGGFFSRRSQLPLGELWIGGDLKPHVSFTSPWNTVRGCVAVEDDEVIIAPRFALPSAPEGDLLQAGPLLLQTGAVMVSPGADPEGFSAACHQFDTDWTQTRNPRAAIGVSQSHIWNIVCDGDTAHGKGMYLWEMAEFMRSLGCVDALNLDGGGSASLVTDGQLLNHPLGDGRLLPRGREIFSALVFTER
jgi:hypothetical protein